jgi:hypothetical protein
MFVMQASCGFQDAVILGKPSRSREDRFQKQTAGPLVETRRPPTVLRTLSQEADEEPELQKLCSVKHRHVSSHRPPAL